MCLRAQRRRLWSQRVPHPGRIVTLMDEAALTQLLADVAKGECSPDDALRAVRRLPFADLGFARIDHHRSLRIGMAETVYAPGKTPEQCAAIVSELLDEPDAPVLLT